VPIGASRALSTRAAAIEHRARRLAASSPCIRSAPAARRHQHVPFLDAADKQRRKPADVNIIFEIGK
jgi:hypothetical protein